MSEKPRMLDHLLKATEINQKIVALGDTPQEKGMKRECKKEVAKLMDKLLEPQKTYMKAVVHRKFMSIIVHAFANFLIDEWQLYAPWAKMDFVAAVALAKGDEVASVVSLDFVAMGLSATSAASTAPLPLAERPQGDIASIAFGESDSSPLSSPPPSSPLPKYVEKRDRRHP